jgi:hypothetical protein
MAIYSGITKQWMQQEPDGRRHMTKKLIVQDGLIASYDMGATTSAISNTIPDIVNGQYNATVYNGPQYQESQNGNLTFDGTNDFMKTPSISNFRMICIFGMKNDSGMSQWRYLVDARPGKSDGYIANGMGGWTLYLNGGNLVTNSWGSIPTDQWFYLCADANATYTSTINFMSRVSDNECLPGKIGSIQIYNRALTVSEMNINYKAIRARHGV